MALAVGHFGRGVQAFEDRRAVARNRRFDPVDFRDVQSQPNYQSALASHRQTLECTACGDLNVFEATSIL